MRYIYILFSFLLPLNEFAQQWAIVGADSIISVNDADAPFIAMDKNNTPYVAYRDAGWGATVKKFNGVKWVTVGNARFTDGDSRCLSIAFDANNTPYVAYMDGAHANKASVMKFNGLKWVPVGKSGFTPGCASYTSIAFDGTGSPCVAFRDQGDTVYNSWPNGFRASVMRFDGSNWTYIGSPAFSAPGVAQGALYTVLTFDSNGTPFVAYTEVSNNFKVTIMKYNGSNWVYVGPSSGISSGGGSNTTMVIDSKGVPYVAYQDNANGGKATVQKFIGASWIPVGTIGVTTGGAGSPFLTIDKYDNLFLAFEDDNNSQKASVMTFDGLHWANVGNVGFSYGEVSGTSIAVANDGALYCAFTDWSPHYNSNGTTYHPLAVMKYDGISNIQERSNAPTLKVFPNPAATEIKVSLENEKKELGQITIINAKGQIVYCEQFIGNYDKHLDVSRYGKGLYVVEVTYGARKMQKKILLD
jgi:hypothetical protein